MNYILVIEGEGRSEVHFFKSIVGAYEKVESDLGNYIDLEDIFGLDDLDITYRVVSKSLLD